MEVRRVRTVQIGQAVMAEDEMTYKDQLLHSEAQGNTIDHSNPTKGIGIRAPVLKNFGALSQGGGEADHCLG